MAHPSIVTGICAGLSAVLVTALPAQARMASELDLRNVAARVVVMAEEGRSDIDLKVAYGSANVPKIMVRTTGKTLTADGGLKSKSIRCNNGRAGDITIGSMGGAKVPVKDLPVIYIKAPQDLVINSHGGVYGEIGAANSLELAVAGCGAWHAGHINDAANISIGGLVT